MHSDYLVLAYYKFVQIEDPHAEVARHKQFFEGRDARSRIYISHEGINGQMSAAKADAESYMKWIHSDPRFGDLEFKIHHHHENVFPKLTIKFREQLVAMDERVDTTKGGQHLSPEEWKRMMEERDEDTILIDTRNDYEWKLGHFEGSELPPLDRFRDFPAYARYLKEKRDPKKTRVMMCCTGGIRCELYSALMKREGFEQVYQLEGGIIKYGLEVGSDHWQGKLFVFDDRLAVPVGNKASVISSCCYCGVHCDTYLNCANTDCNQLFICCSSCAALAQGCCCKECEQAPRVRAFVPSERPKPFRKLRSGGTSSC